MSFLSNLIGVYAKLDWPSKPYDQWILAYNAMVLETYYAAYSTKLIGNSTKRNQNTAICASFFIGVGVITR